MFFFQTNNNAAVDTSRCRDIGQVFLEGDPSKFISCLFHNGEMLEKASYCQLNQYYDSRQEKCVPVPGGGFALQRHDDFCPEKYQGIIRDPLVPQFYHICDNGIGITACCLDEERYNDSIMKCGAESVYTIKTSDASDGSIPIPDCRWTGTYAVPFHLNYYYICEAGEYPIMNQEVKKCDDNTVFDEVDRVCVAQDETSLKMFLPDYNCNDYFSCFPLSDSLYKCVRKHCPENFAFEQVTKHCVPAEDIFCQPQPEVIGATPSFVIDLKKHYDITCNTDESDLQDKIKREQNYNDLMRKAVGMYENKANSEPEPVRIPLQELVSGEVLVKNPGDQQEIEVHLKLKDLSKLGLQGAGAGGANRATGAEATTVISEVTTRVTTVGTTGKIKF